MEEIEKGLKGKNQVRRKRIIVIRQKWKKPNFRNT